ncbi:alkaline phosphatase D family protein [Flavisphingomonas formosensis]|uniref:alkaline phosphatase D family protein n=1 Tax=Flavisphingomonas formosensis TaxID=861534 RepID=UPI001E3FC6E0|nr:alkaline phosphatase D family protein [Sphingomonas formosensis]
MPLFSRRQWLAGAIAAPTLLSIGARAGSASAEGPFTLGVASGDPEPDGIVLWTRLAPRPLEGDGGMPPHEVPVRWEVAEDERFARLVRFGDARAEARWGHSVHVEVTGLAPGRPYYYRFIAQGIASPVGRTRTAPAPGAAVDRLRICYGSCQKYEVGYYAAWRHAVEEDPDLILFLGDYIYEGAPSPGGVRMHLNPEPMDLAGYRVRYATYKLDALLQAAHATAPWAVTWDDHEVANDYANDLDENNGERAPFLLRRAAAYQAYWEHMPLRRRSRPHGAAMQLYRTLDWGRLAQFQIIDDRQFRSGHPCQPADLLPAHKKYLPLVPDCAERHDPRRTILGSTQEDWLHRALGSSRAQWNLLSQQTLMTSYARLDADHPDEGARLYSADTWGGYPAARERILRRWRDAHTPNPLVLSGDIHAFAASDMADPDDDKRILASEFVGGSITSLFHDATFKRSTLLNPGFRFAENEIKGYGRIDLTPGRCDVAFRGLADARDVNSAISTIASFVVEAGRPGMVAA